MTERVVLVTGAARGIGAATVRRLVERGDKVAAVDSCAGEGSELPYPLGTREELDALAVSYGHAIVTHVADGLGWAVRQESGLLLRHWWPLTALATPFSRSVRRALATAVILDLLLFLSERPGVHPVTALVARRVDDLAYGSGLWWGAARRRSARCLLVRRPGQ